jgi:hypothetical protein
MADDRYTCADCGGYGDNVCLECKLVGNPAYFCDECIDAHMESHGQVKEMPEESGRAQAMCQGQGCQAAAMFECGWCHKEFCLLHILDLNEDGKHGDDPIFICNDCAPWNEFGTLDVRW